MRVQFRMDDGLPRERLARLRQESAHGIALAFDVQAAHSTAYMKLNAPWTDRTSAARNGLHAVTTHTPRRFELILAHAVSYGIWLEVKFSGRDAIILPSLRVAVQELSNRLHHLWRKM